MKKKPDPSPKPKKVKNSLKQEMKAEEESLIKNGLQDALLMNPFNDAFGIPNSSIGTQLNQENTLFINNRWYLISNLRQLLSETYVEHGLVQTLVDVPVDDGMRGGVVIKTKQLEEEEIEAIRVEMEQNDDLGTVGQALKWNRLFGGAGILIITDQNFEEPFDIKSLKEDSRLEFRAVDMWELFWSKQNTSDYSAVIDDGANLKDPEFYDYYGHRVHRSRVMLMKGIIAPSFIRPRLRGWGVSIVETLVNSINQYLKANNLIFEVLDEFKVDIYKIKNFANTLLSPNGAAQIQKRIHLANQQKNYQSAIAMDSEDDFLQKELSFAGIAETMVGIRMQIASDMRMPLTKVFGISAAGFNSGEDDIENYNSMVESSVRQKSKFDIIKIIKMRCQKMYGMVPDDLTIEFKPLRVLTSEQEENVKTQKFARLMQAVSGGHMSEEEFKEACNKDNLLPVQLDVNLEKLDASVDEGEGEESGKPVKAAPTKGTVTKPPMAKNSLALDLDSDRPEHLKGDEEISNKVAVVGIICGDEILTGQRRDSGLWVFPGGSVNGDESLEMAALREVHEESGLVLPAKKMKKYPSVKITEANGSSEVTPFICELGSKQMPKTELDPDDEIKLWRWVKLNSDELKPEYRHHDNDVVLAHLKEKMQ